MNEIEIIQNDKIFSNFIQSNEFHSWLDKCNGELESVSSLYGTTN